MLNTNMIFVILVHWHLPNKVGTRNHGSLGMVTVCFPFQKWNNSCETVTCLHFWLYILGCATFCYHYYSVLLAYPVVSWFYFGFFLMFR